ncbi:MAG: hypothetical protein H7Y03_00115 [Chitinophagaceae bacterium]|nr:hypothetical protein [Chitinophagaceae bacterium]
MWKKLVVMLTFFFGTFLLKAQETLPQFSAMDKGSGRIIISWSNPYRDTIRQLSIQRSFDSLRSFKSILTLPDPTVPQNGYVDGQAPSARMYYRLYILLDNGRFLFSKSKRATLDTAGNAAGISRSISSAPSNEVVKVDRVTETARDQIKLPEKVIPRVLYIKVKETFFAQIPESYLKRFRDSINLRTKDTLTLIPPDTILIQPYVPVEVFRASKYVYTEKDGNINIRLPDASATKYQVKFFEEDGTFLFEIKQVKEPLLIVDKSNFRHAGWFRFELLSNNEQKEKSKFFVPKDF